MQSLKKELRHSYIGKVCSFCAAENPQIIDNEKHRFCDTECRKRYYKIKTTVPLAGEHLAVRRKGYWHHGVGDDKGGIIHYSGFSEQAASGPVIQSSVSRFAQGRPMHLIKHTHRKFGILEAVERAKTRIGEQEYHLPSNNCEHFANWCIEGVAVSRQVTKVSTYITGIGMYLAVLLAIDVFAVTGTAAAGSSLFFTAMTEVKYGSGMLLLITGIGCTGGLLMATALFFTLLRDLPWLSQKERRIRRICRVASFATAGITSFGGLAYLYFLAERILACEIEIKAAGDGITRLITLSVICSTALPPVLTTLAGMILYRILEKRAISR
ncbi:lecithin retinol acyltransferase family protein [Lentisphaerota bacterium ZTH]|nr:lecithin retinol acyltransferase family protein [Lentisphaerota bacterium]WET07380.1 lecithin retinol acyltransferase family protein [Lentisphaerota bacterium ZTH]